MMAELPSPETKSKEAMMTKPKKTKSDLKIFPMEQN
jgi:hypothetical protein